MWHLKTNQGGRIGYYQLAFDNGRESAKVLNNQDLDRADSEQVAIEVFEADLEAGSVDVDDIEEARAIWIDAYTKGYEDERFERMIEVISRHGDFAYGNEEPEKVATKWHDAGFSSYEADQWLNARCFRAQEAALLRKAKITSNQAATMTEQGIGAYNDTIGYKVANYDMLVSEAVKLIRQLGL